MIKEDKNLVRSKLVSSHKTTLYTMIKVCIFKKSNSVSRFDKTGAGYQNVSTVREI